jgi:mRNA deadenylase 3'-5' endonuclease subunit Ccr4
MPITDERKHPPTQQSTHQRQHTFTVASYNILADKYARKHSNWLYGQVPASVLDWKHR